MDILRRTSRMEHEGDKDRWPRRGIFVDNEIQVADRSKMNGSNPKMINQKIPDSWADTKDRYDSVALYHTSTYKLTYG